MTLTVYEIANFSETKKKSSIGEITVSGTRVSFYEDPDGKKHGKLSLRFQREKTSRRTLHNVVRFPDSESQDTGLWRLEGNSLPGRFLVSQAEVGVLLQREQCRASCFGGSP